MAELTDVEVEIACARVAKQVDATRTLHKFLLELRQGANAPLISRSAYSDAELREADALHKRYLLRRIREEADRAGISLTED